MLAIEPMINAGTGDIELLDDGWTVVTADGADSAHFEHTVAVRSGAAWKSSPGFRVESIPPCARSSSRTRSCATTPSRLAAAGHRRRVHPRRHLRVAARRRLHGQRDQRVLQDRAQGDRPSYYAAVVARSYRDVGVQEQVQGGRLDLRPRVPAHRRQGDARRRHLRHRAGPSTTWSRSSWTRGIPREDVRVAVHDYKIRRYLERQLPVQPDYWCRQHEIATPRGRLLDPLPQPRAGRADRRGEGSATTPTWAGSSGRPSSSPGGRTRPCRQGPGGRCYSWIHPVESGTPPAVKVALHSPRARVWANTTVPSTKNPRTADAYRAIVLSLKRVRVGVAVETSRV